MDGAAERARDKFVHRLVFFPGLISQVGCELLVAQRFQGFDFHESFTQLLLAQVPGLSGPFGDAMLLLNLFAQDIDMMDFLQEGLGTKSVLHQLVPAVEGTFLFLVQFILPLLFPREVCFGLGQVFLGFLFQQAFGCKNGLERKNEFFHDAPPMIWIICLTVSVRGTDS